MDKTPLVAPLALREEAKEQGRRLVKALDASGIDADAAFWYWVPELGVWRLVIATRDYDRSGPKATYSAIQSLLEQAIIGLTLDDVEVVGPDDPLVSELRARGFAVGGGGTVSFSRPMGESQATVIYRLG